MRSHAHRMRGLTPSRAHRAAACAARGHARSTTTPHGHVAVGLSRCEPAPTGQWVLYVQGFAVGVRKYVDAALELQRSQPIEYDVIELLVRSFPKIRVTQHMHVYA
jgi:hypothetical protein